MKTVFLSKTNTAELQQLLTRSQGSNPVVVKTVRKILREVKTGGDAAVVRNMKQYLGLSNYSLTTSPEEFTAARKLVQPTFIKAIKQAMQNIRTVQGGWFDDAKNSTIRPMDGITTWRQWSAIEKVGIYIPGGKAVYPSSLLMTVIPAQITGCKEVIVCSPPDKTGKLSPYLLVAAEMLGIKQIYKAGGAEAIGAMAYGTQTIPNTYKIFGAGNQYVTEAKMQVFGQVNIDMPAGPSEIFTIADETANPSYIAADLLADGEHAEDSACVLVTPSEKLAKQVEQEIKKQVEQLTTKDRIKKSLKQYGLLVISQTLDDAIKFCNDYAPEHVEVMTKDAIHVSKRITNAGSIFIGDWTSKSAGDYAIGANHVLPTGGMAKMFAPLSVESFGRYLQVQRVQSKRALASIRETIVGFGEVEGLPAHVSATVVRFERSSKNDRTSVGSRA